MLTLPKVAVEGRVYQQLELLVQQLFEVNHRVVQDLLALLTMSKRLL